MTYSRKTLACLVLVSGLVSAQTNERLLSRLEALCTVEGSRGEQSLKICRTHMDENVAVHHLQQYYREIKVWGALTNVREDRGELRVAAKRMLRNITIGVEPSLSATELRHLIDNCLQHERPKRSFGQHRQRPDGDVEAINPELSEQDPLVQIRHLSEPEVELVIFPVEEQYVLPKAAHKRNSELNAEDVTNVITGYRLAYHVATDVKLAGHRELMNYLVDAHSGEIIQRWNMVKYDAAAGMVNTKYNGIVTLYTNITGSTYEAKDPIYCNNYVTNRESSSTPYSDADNIWGNGGNWEDRTWVARQTGAAEALYALQRACQMLQGVWNRNGSSGMGTAMKVVWSQDLGMNTACYPSRNTIIVGCADPFYNDMTKLDILGHEYGHSFDYYTSRFCDNVTGEGGGMAEAHADIMGLLTEVYANYTNNDPNNPETTIPEAGLTDPKSWIMGEDVVKNAVNGGKGLRFFIKPSWDTYERALNNWKPTMAYVEVHAAAGPTDRMFYYLAVGAPSSTTHDGYTSYLPNGSKGIGLHKAANIWIKTMMSGQLTSNSKHIDARNACINTAITLYGDNSAEVAAVRNAYAGINVGQPDPGVVVIISPSATTMYPDVSQSFSVTVTGASDASVVWTCTGGTVNDTGNYTSPWVETTQTYQVRATSVADTTRYAEATITVHPATTITYDEVESNDHHSDANTSLDLQQQLQQHRYHSVIQLHSDHWF